MVNLKPVLAAVLIFFIAETVSAQQPAAQKARFSSINQAGMLNGQGGPAFQFQTINGVRYRSWFYGIGVGIDDYRYRTIPLFADVRKEFGKTKNRFFVYADAGVNLPHVKDDQRIHYTATDKFSIGFYSDAGVGYRIKTGPKTALLLNAGYSFKHVGEKTTTLLIFPTPFGFTGTFPSQTDRYNYNLNRLSFKLGFEF